MKLKAIVEPCQNDYVIANGYHWTVLVFDSEDETDLIDLLDFNTKEEALNKAEEINNNPHIEQTKDLSKFY